MNNTKNTIVNGDDPISVTPEDIVELDLIKTSDGSYHAVLGGQSYSISVQDINYGNRTIDLIINGSSYHLNIKGSTEQMIEKMGFNTIDTSSDSNIKAPMPGLVLKVLVTIGQKVNEGDHLCILEAMKMENVLKSPSTGILKSIHVENGASVNKGDILMEVEPS